MNAARKVRQAANAGRPYNPITRRTTVTTYNSTGSLSPSKPITITNPVNGNLVVIAYFFTDEAPNSLTFTGDVTNVQQLYGGSLEDYGFQMYSFNLTSDTPSVTVVPSGGNGLGYIGCLTNFESEIPLTTYVSSGTPPGDEKVTASNTNNPAPVDQIGHPSATVYAYWTAAGMFGADYNVQDITSSDSNFRMSSAGGIQGPLNDLSAGQASWVPFAVYDPITNPTTLPTYTIGVSRTHSKWVYYGVTIVEDV